MRRASEAAVAVIKATFAHVQKKQLKTMAGSLAYTTVLSIIPLLALAFFAVQSLGLLESGFLKLQPWILENLAPGASAKFNKRVLGFLHNSHFSALGVAGSIGVFITAIVNLNQFNDALNQIMETPDERNFARKLYKNTIVMLVIPILLTLSIMISAVIPLRGFIITLLIDMVAFALAYGLLPRHRPQTKPLLLASAFMALFWELTKSAYTFYATKAVSYSQVYGSLSAIPLFLMWIYIAWYVVLLGAALLKTMNDSFKPRRKA